VHVKAVDKATNKEQKITVTASTGLSEEEIEKMRQEAELHAEDDRKRKELVEVRNSADSLIYTAEKTLNDAKEKAKPEDVRAVEDAIAELKSVHTSEDASAIQAKVDQLSEKLQVVGAAMYQQNQAETETKADETSAEPGDTKSEE
jgi:molecular chaperone DnaK